MQQLGTKTAYENWVTAPNKQLICGARIKDKKVNVIVFLVTRHIFISTPSQ